MSRFGAHAFIWAGEWTAADAKKVITGVSQAGLDLVEIPLLHPEGIDVPQTRALLDEHGVGCTCSLALPKEAHLPFAPERAEMFLKGAVDVCHALGAQVLTGALYTHLGTLTGKPPDEAAKDAVAGVIKRVAHYSADREISLGLEVINRYENYLLNTAAQAIAMLDRIDEDNVFVHLDTYHMNIEEKGFYEPIVSLGDHVGYIHLSESDRGTPGSGNVHWDEVFRGLKAIRYNGPLVMESFAAINRDIIAATAMWRDVVGDPDVMIRDGLAFLREKAAAFRLDL